MTTYTVTAVNIGSFNLGESDKLLTLFTAERGLMKAVAKGARKPGSKMSGKSELLNSNTLFLSTGRTLDIITQAQSLETFANLRKDLVHLSYGLYYAELTQAFGQGLSEESGTYFDFLQESLRAQAQLSSNPTWLALRFELGLLDLLGYKPELTYCVMCRQILTDFTLAAFHQDGGGIVCRNCFESARSPLVRESNDDQSAGYDRRAAIQITPLVWKQLILASGSCQTGQDLDKRPLVQALQAAQRLIQSHLEHRAGKKLKSLELVKQLDTS